MDLLEHWIVQKVGAEKLEELTPFDKIRLNPLSAILDSYAGKWYLYFELAKDFIL